MLSELHHPQVQMKIFIPRIQPDRLDKIGFGRPVFLMLHVGDAAIEIGPLIPRQRAPSVSPALLDETHGILPDRQIR